MCVFDIQICYDAYHSHNELFIICGTSEVYSFTIHPIDFRETGKLKSVQEYGNFAI